MKNTKYDLILKNGNCWLPSQAESPLTGVSAQKADIGILNGSIVDVGSLDESSAEKVVECSGLDVLPGLIDTQVHFREPGLEHKEDLHTGTAGAIQGGITAVFEMPNTKPSTITKEDFEDKIKRGHNRAWCDYAFYIGACEENADLLPELETLPGCSGVKMFMGSSTGSLLVDKYELLEKVVKNGRRRMAVHCEDEARLNQRKHLVTDAPADVKLHPVWRDEETALKATQTLLELAIKHQRPVHVLHVTTKQEMQFLSTKKDHCTVECTPQHLTLFAPDCYDDLGTLAQMNPPIRTKDHQQALWQGLENKTIDIIGSDHAPHTLAEKLDQQYPNTPSGMTGVQTSVPIMLNHVCNGKLSLDKFIELMCLKPCQLFNMLDRGVLQPNYKANITIVDMNKKMTITNDWIESKSGWTPFNKTEVQGWPTMTIINGNIVMQDGQKKGDPIGTPINFN